MQLSYNCYMNQTGYSIAAQEYIKSMMREDPTVNIKCNFVNKGNVGLGMSKNRNQYFRALEKKKDEFPQTSIYHTLPMLYRRPRQAKKHVGVALFETINPPSNWVNQMNEMDTIVTATDFNKNIFLESGVNVPIHVIPHCFDERMFNKDVLPEGRYSKFTFFSMGTWKKRKNWETLIKAFYEAFEAKDNVCLIIKTDKVDKLREAVVRIKRTGDWRSKNTASIYAEEKSCCHFEEIPSIMKKADSYISASLGEGFGLPGLHAMALGIPVITTKFGGVLQYAKPNLCTYIEPSSYRTQAVMDGIPQFNRCIWPVVKISDVAAAMRSVYGNLHQARNKAVEAYKFVHDNFTYRNVGKKFIDAVKI